MELNKKIIVTLVIIIIVIAGIFYLKSRKQENVTNQEQINETKLAQDENTKKEIEELKKETGATANEKLYEIQLEYDGKKFLNIKPEIQYKIAFAGIIQNNMPALEQIDDILKKEYPQNNGIWIESNSRKQFLELLNNNTNNQYEITEQGYLKILKEINPNEQDKSLKKMINANNQYIITISGTYYEADRVTGEILNNFYEEIDPYQASKTVQWDNNIIIFLTTNKENKLTNSDILTEITKYGK